LVIYQELFSKFSCDYLLSIACTFNVKPPYSYCQNKYIGYSVAFEMQ
jgi:hypothetical protein